MKKYYMYVGTAEVSSKEFKASPTAIAEHFMEDMKNPQIFDTENEALEAFVPYVKAKADRLTSHGIATYRATVAVIIEGSPFCDVDWFDFEWNEIIAMSECYE